MRRELTANKAQALLARIRPADDVAAVRLHIARDHLADIRALDARLKYIAGQIAALVPGTDGRRPRERKRTEGKTPKEALRCLKRRLSDQVWRQLVRDQQGRIEACGSPTTQPPTPPTSTSPASGSPAAASSRPHPDLLEEAEILS